MKTINWKDTGWFARNFVFFRGQEMLGQLSFNNSWNLNAVYAEKGRQLKFKQKNFLNTDIYILQDGKTVGEIRFKFWGNPVLKLVSGEGFELSTNSWGRNVQWKAMNGDVIIRYQQTVFSSMRKGTATFIDSLKDETEKILVSSGIYIRQLKLKRAAMLIAIMIPILAAANH